MKKFIRRVVKTFKRLSDARLLAFGQNVTVCMAAAVDAFPNPTPTLADINTELAKYAGLLQTSATRDRVQVELKNQSKYALHVMLSQLADYINGVTSDAAQLVRTGYEMNKIGQPVTLKAPTRLVLTDGINSGTMLLKCKRVPGAASYLFQYTSDPAMAESSWVRLPSTSTSYLFTGLSRSTVYHCRVASVGGNSQVMNSIILNRVAQ